MNNQKQKTIQYPYPGEDWKFNWMGFADIYDRIKKKEDFPKKKMILAFIKTFNGKTLFDLADYLNVIMSPDRNIYFGKRTRYTFKNVN